LPISREEFLQLPKEKPERAAVGNEELLSFLSEGAYTTGEVAAFLGVKQGTAYSRLKRLLQAGLVEVRYLGQKAYWMATAPTTTI